MRSEASARRPGDRAAEAILLFASFLVLKIERLGYRADVAANGLEAVEALTYVSYDAILMDVQMPEMDGYEATKEIRGREKELHVTPLSLP